MKINIKQFSIIPLTYAATEKVDIGAQVDANNFFKYKCLADMVTKAIDFALIIGALVVLVMLIWGGLEWMTNGGDKAHVENAQKRMTNAVIGLGVLAVSWAIWVIVIQFFGIQGDICNPKTI